MTTCREFFTFSWPLRGRVGGRPKRSAWPLFSRFFFFWLLPLVGACGCPDCAWWGSAWKPQMIRHKKEQLSFLEFIWIKFDGIIGLPPGMKCNILCDQACTEGSHKWCTRKVSGGGESVLAMIFLLVSLNNWRHSHEELNTGKTVLAAAASLLLTLLLLDKDLLELLLLLDKDLLELLLLLDKDLLELLLLLDKDLLELCQRLVPRLRQGCQGKGCPKQESAGVEEEYALDANQAGQVGKCLWWEALMW